ncbi:MAG: hypothetical protein ABI867_36330 [Kofleriaceae bacterium]
MMMSIKVWQSFSCNNSSSARLVARFADAATAAETAAELRAFFTQHAQEMDATMETGDFPDENPAAAQALAKQYGFQWVDVLTWGDEMLGGDEPMVETVNEVLVAYHTYCGGGFGDVPKYLQARGGTVIDEGDRGAPSMSVLFAAVPGANPELEADLAMLFGQVSEESREVEPLKTPWPANGECNGTAAFFRDSKSVGLYFPIEPDDYTSVKTWLTKHGITKSSMQVCEDADEAAFVAISAATCSACGNKLDYLDPRIHDIESPQLVCTPCGGLYELATFLAKPG